MPASSTAKLLARFFQAGVNAVSGEQSVIRALQQDEPFAADLIIAVGKAASSMCLGALQALSKPCPALVVTKYEHADAAGGIIDGHTAVEATAAADALRRADAGTYLRQTGDIFITGPSNTNVMDLTIAVVS